MSIDNSNFQDKQEEIRSSDYLSEFQYKKNSTSQNENFSRNCELKQNNIQKQQTQSEFKSKPQRQKETQIQHQEKDFNQFYPSQKSFTNSFEEQEKQEIQFQQNQTIILKEYSQICKNSQACRNSQLNIQPVFNINIQISRIYYQTPKPQYDTWIQQNRIKKEQKEYMPIQQTQSNIFQPYRREIINTISKNQIHNSSFNSVNSKMRSSLPKVSLFENRLGMKDDPTLKEKQDILTDIHEILKQLAIKSNSKKHSILEDAFQLCLFYLPNIREFDNKIASQQFYEKMTLLYQIERNFQAFVRRYYHLLVFSDCWTLQNLQKIHEILMKSEEISLQSYHINYNIRNKTIEFPELNFIKKQPEKPKAIQQIIQNQQNKKIVLSLTTKALFQYVNLSAQEIDEDIQEFDDELQFVEMILKLIPLAL